MQENAIKKGPNTRNEADIGKHYERQILALLALKCVLDENIEDFWIKFNPTDVEKFDDIILHVKYKTGRNELFMMQLKHKTGKRPISAKKFESTQKDLNLDKLQKGFKDITVKKIFFEANDISEDTRKFFVLYNNSTIYIENTENSDTETEVLEKNIHEENLTSEGGKNKLQFEPLVETDFRAFLSSKSFKESTGYKLKSRQQVYDQNFLDNFYFYPEQLNLEDVKPEIEHLSGSKDVADNLIHYFDEFTKPTNKTEKIEKLDVKIQLLSSIFGNFQPSTTISTQSPILDIVKKFNVTVISDDYSENVIWNEILLEIRNHCNEDSLELSSWQDRLPPNLQEQFGCQTRVKDLYFRMVASLQIPFYIKTDNISYPVFLELMFPKMGVCMVVFNHKNEKLQFTDLKVFETMRDFDDDSFHTHEDKIRISFRNKRKLPLLAMVGNDNCVRENITADLFIKLQSHCLRIGVRDNSDQIYIKRTIKIPTIKEDILVVSKDILYIICNFPSEGGFKKFKYALWKVGEDDDDFQRCTNHSNFDEFGITDEYYNIITTTKSYSTELVEQVHRSTSLSIFYFLQYVDQDEEGCRFILIKTNGKKKVLIPHLSETTKSDLELIPFLNVIPVNFICNKGGMGKSMLLKYLVKYFPPNEWVIHAELGKYRTVIDKIENFDDFMNFFYDYGISGADSEFGDISRHFYEYHKQKGKLTFLLDDCDEVVNPKLLNFLKEATNKGMKFWIAARPGLREEFENIFETFSMELCELTVEDQTRFFKKFYRKMGIKGRDISRKLRSIETARQLLENSFIGNCQQTMMLAVVFNTDEEPSLKENRVDELYEKFINLKINQHYDKNRDFIVRTVSKLALVHFFSEAVLKKIFDWSEFQCDIEVFRNENPKTALVAYFDEDNIPEFTHKTYAEFLAGRWLAQNVRRQIEKKTPFNLKEIVRLLYHQEFTNVRLFFDSILIERNPLAYTEEHRTDILGRNFMHIFLSYGDRYDMHTDRDIEYAVRVVEEHPQIKSDGKEILVKVPDHPIVTRYKGIVTEEDRFPPNLDDFALKKDNFLGMDPVECALATGCLKKLNTLMTKFDYIFIEFSFSLMKFNIHFMLVHCIKNQLNHILRRLEVGEELLKVRDMSSHMSLLHMAVDSVNIEAVKLLLEAFPLRKWGTDSENNTPLHYALRREYKKSLDIFQQFLNPVSDIFNLKNSKGYTHLHCAVQHKNIGWTKLILSCPGVEVDAECSQGNTPFILSIINCKLQIVKLLKNNQADINHKNKRGWTALHFTASIGLLKCTQQLTKWGAELDIKNSFGETPLIRATIKGNKAIVKWLLKHNVNINESDNNKWTALHHAVKRNKISILRLLLQNGANVDAINKTGESPLIIACRYDFPQAVEILLSNNASVDYRSEMGTALDISSDRFHSDCVRMITNKLVDRMYSYLFVNKKNSHYLRKN